MSLEEEILALVDKVQSSRETLDDATRMKAVKATQGLLGALTSPPEIIIKDIVLNPAHFMALRIGVQIGLFQIIRDSQGGGVTTEEIADKSGASPIVVDQILRTLSATGYVLEVDVQTYKPSPLTFAMADSTLESATRACFDIGNYTSTYAPEYFRRNGNQFPPSAEDTPFQLAKNTKFTYFAWLEQNPSLAKDFQQWMAAKEQATLNWVDWFDVEKVIFNGFQEKQQDGSEGVLLVDMGAGEGKYLHTFNKKFPAASGRRVLQDLPNVVENISEPPSKTELMAHDFFNPQPVKGARTYFLHWILHDWTDEKAREILSHIADAMEPGYSRLIINDQIIPDTGCDFFTACINTMMMVQVASLERTEQQWRKLLASVGLTDVSFHQPPGVGEGVVLVKK
ncbi:sterigmatocystin 8-O-methyltransferase precursor [Aspergillus karnatakaensis]|uniref:sterigmatocystin 8-O-methyltransferase precursor n=1 Tax=Aspergillus karnatakaensis TaxID=1810916 RepID=UPI003CCCBF0F